MSFKSIRFNFSSRDVKLPEEYFAFHRPSNAARMVIRKIFERVYGTLQFAYQIMFIDRMLMDQALSIDKKFYECPQNQILNEIKYPYICNYGYHIYPKWRNIPPKPRVEFRFMMYHILFGRGSGRPILDLLKNMSFIQRNIIYGCLGVPKESIVQIEFKKTPSKILVESDALRRRMINQKFLEEVDINANDN